MYLLTLSIYMYDIQQPLTCSSSSVRGCGVCQHSYYKFFFILFSVLGAIEPSSAGIVLTHEHLSISSAALGVRNQDARFTEYETVPVTMDSLWWIRQNPYG